MLPEKRAFGYLSDDTRITGKEPWEMLVLTNRRSNPSWYDAPSRPPIPMGALRKISRPLTTNFGCQNTCIAIDNMTMSQNLFQINRICFPSIYLLALLLYMLKRKFYILWALTNACNWFYFYCILFARDLGPHLTRSNDIVGFQNRVVNHLSEIYYQELVQSHHRFVPVMHNFSKSKWPGSAHLEKTFLSCPWHKLE